MTNAVRSYLKQVHHLPWVCAGIILAAGLANWAMFTRHPEAPPQLPEPPKPPAMFLDENAFRQAMMPQEVEAPLFGQEPSSPSPAPSFPAPFGFEEAQSPLPGESSDR